MANPTSITLSSVGTSDPVALDWRSGARTSFVITGSSSGTFSVVPEFTLDDVMLSSSPTWIAASSAALTSDSSTWQVLGVIAGIRLNSTALSSAVLTLRVLQDHGY